MVHLPKDWRFLRAAWLYAVVLTGDANRSLDLVQSVLAGIGRRQDLVGLRRRRRLFFALVRREASEGARRAQADFIGPSGLFELHRMSEPGRSALALFHLRLFTPEELAGVLGLAEKNLPEILAAARGEFSGTAPLAA